MCAPGRRGLKLSTTYSLAQTGAEEAERSRLSLLEQICDPMTTRMFDNIGLKPGWRCLDVGAGAGSVSRNLARLVGPDGSVLAIDLDTRLLEDLAGGNTEVRCHDFLASPVGTGFDLVHARHLLMHLPNRIKALSCMVDALRPGGILAIGDVTMADVRLNGRSPEWERAWSAVLDTFVSVGWDPSYGDRLTSDLEAVGLADVCSEQNRMYRRGGSDFARLLVGTIQRLRDRIDAAQSDLDEMLRLLEEPSTGLSTPTVIMAWGRRP